MLKILKINFYLIDYYTTLPPIYLSLSNSR